MCGCTGVHVYMYMYIDVCVVSKATWCCANLVVSGLGPTNCVCGV